MKRLFIIIAAVLLTVTVCAQSPQKMSYQAVIRNSSDQLVTNHTVGMRISILHGSAAGTPVYVETQTPATNANGLVTIEIGAGTIVTGTFAIIDWSTGNYFIKTETDPSGSTSYTISGTSQLLSVPYALHAETVASYPETDPVFVAHASHGISVSSITNWNTSYGWGNHALAGYLTSGNEGDGVIGNEMNNVTNATLLRSGTGTSVSPFTVGLNLANTNTWTAPQSFNSNTSFPGSGVWNTDGNVGIGTTNPVNKLQIQNGNMVIDRSVSTSVLSLGTVAGVTGRIFAGDAGGGSLNTNYNQIKLTANPNNSEELIRLHTGADAMSNSGTSALYFGQFNLTDMAAIKAVNEGGQPLNRTAGLSFWTEPAGTGVPLLERMRIAGNGNVGIGTNSPGTKLDVTGIISATGGNSTNWNTSFGWGNHADLYRPVSWVPAWTDVTAKPVFATVATSGSYSDLINTPAIDGSETKLTAGKNITITGNGTIGTPYIANVKKSDFYLGQDTLGGIVYYIYSDSQGNQHGLIVAKTETTGQWQTANSITNANRSWDGAYNTALMTNSPAATYVTGLGAGWYLPSFDELSLLWHSRFHVNKAMNGGGFTLLSNSANYWSSTEIAVNSAYLFEFSYAKGGYTFKTDTYNVRAVRSF